MENNPYIFNLSSVVEYSKGGDFHKTATLELYGPTMPVFELSSAISQMVMRAVLDARSLSEEVKPEQLKEESEVDKNIDEVMDVTAMKVILLSSKNVKFSDLAMACKKLFVKVGTFDGEVKLKTAVLDKISVDDYTRLVCEYVVNFIFPSLFSSPEGAEV